MNNVYWQGSEYDYFQSVTEDWCRQTCLADCYYTSASFLNGKCWLRGAPQLNGRIDNSFMSKTLIKIRKCNSTSKSAGSANTKRKDVSTLIVVGSVLLSSLGFLNILLPLITYLIVSCIYSRKVKVIQPCPVMQGMNLKCFTYEELKEATNQRSSELICVKVDI
ncbi:unnamed protein product [Prunus brigantina]